MLILLKSLSEGKSSQQMNYITVIRISKMFSNKIFSAKTLFFILICWYTRGAVIAQTAEVMNRCGGSHFVTLPAFQDIDQDGLSDTLEKILLQHFVPVFIQYNDDDCPGLSTGTSGMADTNLVVCRIFPLFQQYVSGSNVSSIQAIPSPLVNEKCLYAGLTWYDNRVVIYGAVLYGRDCGLNGHIADVESFSILLKNTNDNDDLLWRYDTVLSHWKGITIQTTAHAGTLCQSVETYPYRSNEFPNGKDTIFVSPDKHGNYLTIPICNGNFCNPDCNDTPSVKNIRIINAGEVTAPFITDLGIYYTGYSGESPWSDTNFLGGEAGTIKEKLLASWRSDFINGQTINSCNDICSIYNDCYNCADAYTACNDTCQNIGSAQTGCNVPLYECMVSTSEYEVKSHEINVFPNPAKLEVVIAISGSSAKYNVVLRNSVGQIVKQGSYASPKITIETGGLSSGIYLLQINNEDASYEKQLLVE